MNIVEIKPEDKKYIDQIIEIEKEAFGENGGVDEWILKPLIRYGKVYVLIIDEIVVGIAEYMNGFENKESFLYGFSIKKEYRKNGYGKKLLEDSMEVLSEKYGVKKILLTTQLENRSAIFLYEKVGFYKDKILKNEYGEGVDRYLFIKKINKKK